MTQRTLSWWINDGQLHMEGRCRGHRVGRWAAAQSRAHSQATSAQWASHKPRLPLRCLSPSKALQNMKAGTRGPSHHRLKSLGRGSRRRNSTVSAGDNRSVFPAGAAPHSGKAALAGVGHTRVTGREQLHKGWAYGMLEGTLQPGVGSTGTARLRTW